MKRMAWMAIGTAFLLTGAFAAGQSLGDVARANRKTKPHDPNVRQFDNDNLPKTDHLSVVGPEAAPETNATTEANTAAGTSSQSASATTASANATTPQTAAADKSAKQQADDPNQVWKKKIDAQKKKIDDLARDLDLTQREYRLKAVAMYADAGNRLRNAAQWAKEDRDYKQQIDEKQKKLDSAKQELDNMMEDARKAGVPSSMRE